ncbi:MAG: hypothetical protein H6719_07675 [Sandaracinaceae bacterium]|nr:hypothetical protein [Sandaracinaceae bacterium]
MTRRILSALVLFALGCGGAPPPVPPVATCPEPELPPPPPPEPANRCAPLFAEEPAAPPAEELPLSATCADDARGERAAREQLLREYHRSREPSRIDVSFGCDPLRAEVRVLELVQEFDYGGSSHFTVARLERPAEGDVTVRALRLDLPAVRGDEMTWESAIASELTRSVGTIPRAELDAILSSARAALVASLREVELPHPAGRVTIMAPRVGAVQTAFSIRVVDEAGAALERRGITATSGPRQRDWLGPTVVTRDLWDLIELHASWERAPAAPAPSAADDLELVRGALQMSGRVGEAAPWSGPSYLALLARLRIGLSPSAMLEVLAPAPAEEPATAEGPIGVRLPFLDRARAVVIDELARRTGWDARRGADGAVRPVADVASDYVQECARASAP